MEPAIPAILERVFRQERGQVLASLIGWLGDIELAEDVFQETMLVALERWQPDTLPARPGAWLTTVARRKAIDMVRHTSTRSYPVSLQQLQVEPSDQTNIDDALEPDALIPDDRLKLILLCCHPALPPEAQIALTLTTVGGLTTAEVARAFLTPLPTMAQRLVRAKRKIRTTAIPFTLPGADTFADRIDTVMQVIYLIFTEGYQASHGGDLVRTELCDEAIRLARMLNVFLGRLASIPEQQRAEALGLLALLLLHDARRSSRQNADGTLVLLADQDRMRWNQAQIRTGQAFLDKAMSIHQPGPYQLQAAISALHAEASSADATDWPQIALLYAELLRYTNTPVIALNHAIAVSMAHGPEAGLHLLVPLAAPLDQYYPFHLARANMLRRLGDSVTARQNEHRALELCENEVERNAIQARLAKEDL